MNFPKFNKNCWPSSKSSDCDEEEEEEGDGDGDDDDDDVLAVVVAAAGADGDEVLLVLSTEAKSARLYVLSVAAIEMLNA